MDRLTKCSSKNCKKITGNNRKSNRGLTGKITGKNAKAEFFNMLIFNELKNKSLLITGNYRK